MNFLGAVNRVLRSNGIIKGDDDAVTTFSDLQHNATLNIAQIAIQAELNSLISDNLIPYEKTSGTIVTVSGTRSYALAADFIRFYGDPALLYNSADNRQIFEYPGGENILRRFQFDYKTATGVPNYFYFEQTTTKKISFYQVPNEVKTWSYDYEKDVSVTSSTDTMPFHNESEAQTFCEMAGIRFKYLFEGKQVAGIIQDPIYLLSKSVLFSLMVGKNPRGKYGSRYA